MQRKKEKSENWRILQRLWERKKIRDEKERMDSMEVLESRTKMGRGTERVVEEDTASIIRGVKRDRNTRWRRKERGETWRLLEGTRRRCGQDCAKARLTLISSDRFLCHYATAEKPAVFPSYVCLFTPLLKSQTEKVEGRLFRRGVDTCTRMFVSSFAGNRYRVASAY